MDTEKYFRVTNNFHAKSFHFTNEVVKFLFIGVPLTQFVVEQIFTFCWLCWNHSNTSQWNLIFHTVFSVNVLRSSIKDLVSIATRRIQRCHCPYPVKTFKFSTFSCEIDQLNRHRKYFFQHFCHWFSYLRSFLYNLWKFNKF